ncbi:hypothetical protein L484_012953 [Morus notabilis]|uniref:Uncharacterized protein n=1 Tax=Morus notabilis TaxID=981085 RepID=W9SBY4_9ROSA|nr:hypothetical protein L484_012953 [Morus notabilis]
MKSTLDSRIKIRFGVDLNNLNGLDEFGKRFTKAFDDSNSGEEDVLLRFLMESEKDPENMTNKYYSRQNIKPSYQLINFHRLQPSTRVIHCLIYSAGKLRLQTLQSQMLSTFYGKVVQVHFHVKPQFLGTEGMESI